MSKLTAKKVENALPREKEYKLHDGGGLFLRIRPSGAKSWLFSFSLPKDRKLIRMTLGSVKNMSLKEARAKLPELRDQISQGIDPRYRRTASQTVTFKTLEENDFDEIVSAFELIGWNKPKSQYEAYFKEQLINQRLVIIAKMEETFCGYVTIKWQSEYSSFAQMNIPEISDLNVLPAFRKRGIGGALINICETIAKERGYKKIGLGVGLTGDYGNAQRLYVQLGYIPDGQGLHYKNLPVNYSEQTIADDDLVIYLVKPIENVKIWRPGADSNRRPAP